MEEEGEEVEGQEEEEEEADYRSIPIVVADCQF